MSNGPWESPYGKRPLEGAHVRNSPWALQYEVTLLVRGIEDEIVFKQEDMMDR